MFRRFFKIKKGKHRSGFHFGIHYPNNLTEYECRFPAEAWYERGAVGDTGINKLRGFSLGLWHHKYSVRIGWQPDFNVKEKIKLYLYMYVNGERMVTEIGSVSCGETFIVSIYMEDPVYKTVSAKLHQTRTSSGVMTRAALGYNLYPYFGGNSTSPETMIIYARKL